MRLKAKGRWIRGALDSMLRSNQQAADCFLRQAAHACTDVSGFGLLGHLFEMVRISNLQVRLSLPAVPLLEGAIETAGAGIQSSLQPQNLRLRGAVRNLRLASRAPAFPLLFDPQTAGGLLASVPDQCSETCVEELRAGGDSEAAIIGAVEAKQDGRESITIDL
jgi:selenide,water dikinase